MLKVRTLFSGIGAPEKALEMINIPFELVDFCEFDKYAVKSYCAVHNISEDKNLGDITKVDETKLAYADLLVWGFPCTDISVAGNQLGIVQGKTRSGLYYEGLRILKATMPKYSIIENVKNLVGKKFKAEFDQMLKDLVAIGYVNYWQVLNAKRFGVAQNRERVFIVSIRKDVDTGDFEFPVGFDNGLRLKDFLEDEVDEKFYLSEEYVERFRKSLESKALQNKIPHDGVYTVLGTTVNPEAKGTNSRHWVYDTDKLSSCLAATDYKQPKQIIEFPHEAKRLGGIFDTETKHQAGSIWDKEGIAPTLDTMQGGYRQPSVLLEPKVMCVNTKDENGVQPHQHDRVYDTAGVMTALMAEQNGRFNILEPTGFVAKKYDEFIDDKGYVPEMFNPYNRAEIKGEAPTLSTYCGSTTSSATVLKYDGYRIRKLTPKECWLLMGFDVAAFERAEKVNSNSQLYKQAGNSIVTTVLCGLLMNLLKVK